MKKKITVNKLYIFFLILVSLAVNQYYGYQGVLPIDSFLIFNSGYDILNGHIPFRDYWTIKEPIIDFMQSLYFRFLGVNWFAYVFHASSFNALTSVVAYLSLKKLNLNISYCFFYSLCFSILFYSTSGTPFSDLHTLGFCIIALFCFILAIENNNKYLWFLLPVVLSLSFFSKQSPTIYFALIFFFSSIYYFYFFKKKINFLYSIAGLIVSVLIFFFIISITEIKFVDFLYQYIFFPQSLAESRLEWVFPIEFKRFVWRFKLLYLSCLVFFYIFFKEILRKHYFKKNIIVSATIISSLVAIIFHQLMTINGYFIYCLIPIYCGLSTIYFKKNFLENKKINYFFILLTAVSTIYYFSKYVNTRSFMDLKNVNLQNSVDGSYFDKKLKNLKWINVFYPDNPLRESELLNSSIQIILKENRKFMLVTDYQFISVFNNFYDNSVSRFWWEFHGYPDKENRYFSYWKKYFLNKIIYNNIEVIFIIKPLAAGEISFDHLLINCQKKLKINDILDKIYIGNCY